MENTAQHAIALLRNRMTGDDVRQLSDTDLYQLESICHHWQAMAEAERKSRVDAVKNAARQGNKSANTIPSVPMPDQLQYDGYRCFHYDVSTPCGSYKVEVRGYSLYCRGTLEDIVSCGLVRLEWLPGFPGNGNTSNSVVFDETGPRVVVGRERGVKSQQRINIRAWGHVRRTVDVQVPMTEEQIKQVEALYEQKKQAKANEQYYEREDSKPIAPIVQSQHRASGNVIYLQQRT